MWSSGPLPNPHDLLGMWGEEAGSPRAGLGPEAALSGAPREGWALGQFVPEESKGFKEDPHKAVLPEVSKHPELVILFCLDQPGVNPTSVT